MDIQQIIEAIRRDRVRITDHADEEAQADRLSYDEIFDSVIRGRLIEDYPDDKPYPSCLVYGSTLQGEPVHSVWAYDSETEWAVMITTYRPDPTRWIDWHTREADGMRPISKCPMCGGATIEKEVEKLLRGGVNFASVTVSAEVCLHCGERLYSTDTVKQFEQVRAKLSSQEVSEFEPLGQSFQVR